MSTPLPTGWVNGRMYRALFRRAQFDPEARLSYRDHARRYGISPTSTPALLKRAGLENDGDSQVVERKLSPDEDSDKQIRQMARDLRGKFFELVADADGVVTAAKFRIPSQARIVGEVEIPVKRERRPPTISDCDNLPKPAPAETPYLTRRVKRQPPVRLAASRRSLNARWIEAKLNLVKPHADCFSRTSSEDKPMFAVLSHPVEVEDRTITLAEEYPGRKYPG